MIARSDGKEIPIGDPFAKQILFDVIEFYLHGKVLEERASDPITPRSATLSKEGHLLNAMRCRRCPSSLSAVTAR